MDEKMIQDLIIGLQEIYGSDLIKITLYGSYARQTQTEESDIDIAVLLMATSDKAKERQLIKFCTKLDLKYDKVFSVLDIEYTQYQKWVHAMPFYRNIEKEGVTLWKAA